MLSFREHHVWDNFFLVAKNIHQELWDVTKSVWLLYELYDDQQVGQRNQWLSTTDQR